MLNAFIDILSSKICLDTGPTRRVGIMLQIFIIILFLFPLTSLYYAQFYSFYAFDSIIILHLQLNSYKHLLTNSYTSTDIFKIHHTITF